MTVKELKEKLGLTEIAVPLPEREVRGAYIGDLLSWVMGRAKEDNAWITIMSNANVIAVASLSDVSVIILAEGVRLDLELVTLALEKGINVLGSDMDAYRIAGALTSLNI
jgi:hypothetical protein